MAEPALKAGVGEGGAGQELGDSRWEWCALRCAPPPSKNVTTLTTGWNEVFVLGPGRKELKMAWLLRADGQMELVILMEDVGGQIAQLKERVGGVLEVVRPLGLPRTQAMIIDENGLAKGKPPNVHATALYWHGTAEEDIEAPITGDVVIVNTTLDLDNIGDGEETWY